MSGYACLNKDLAGWSEQGGCKGGLCVRCLESSGAFHISAVSKSLLMFCLAFSDVLILCDRLCLSLHLKHKPSPSPPLRLRLHVSLSESCLCSGAYGKSITGGPCLKDMSFLIICFQRDLGGWPQFSWPHPSAWLSFVPYEWIHTQYAADLVWCLECLGFSFGKQTKKTLYYIWIPSIPNIRSNIDHD